MAVVDHSMEPTLLPGDRLLVEGGTPIGVGDLVAVRDPELPSRWLVKRVAGIPGDRLQVTRTGVVRTPPGRPAPEPTEALEEVDVPPGHLFLLSDRLSGSRDSREFGPVDSRLVVGRVWHRYYPVERAGSME